MLKCMLSFCSCSFTSDFSRIHGDSKQRFCDKICLPRSLNGHDVSSPKPVRYFKCWKWKKTCWNCTKRNIPFHPYGPTCKQITFLLHWFPTYFPENSCRRSLDGRWWQVCSSCRFGPMCQLGSGALEYLGMEHMWRGHMQIRIDSKALVWLVTHCLAHVPATAIQRVRLRIHCLQGLHTSPSSNSHNPKLHPAVSSFRKSAWIESNRTNSHWLSRWKCSRFCCLHGSIGCVARHLWSWCAKVTWRIRPWIAQWIAHGTDDENNRCTFRTFRVKARIPRCGVWKPRNSAGHSGPTPKGPMTTPTNISLQYEKFRLKELVTTLWFVCFNSWPFARFWPKLVYQIPSIGDHGAFQIWWSGHWIL